LPKSSFHSHHLTVTLNKRVALWLSSYGPTMPVDPRDIENGMKPAPSGWHDIRISISPRVSFLGDQMGEVISFPKPNPDRDTARLIQEARALYESVFPTENGPASVQQDTPAQT
jgi:hypothetical protein